LNISYSNGLKRLATRCCGFWSYRHAADNLRELCGVPLSHTTVGEIANKTAGEIAEKLPNITEIRNTFQKAKGETEFYADGTSVHIRNDEDKAEWREMKAGVLARRECGASAAPSEWATRKLPEPTVASAFAAIESKEEFQERCQAERRRVGVGGVASAVGDGALWIWSLIFMVFGKTRECLDIYHALEHVAACGKALYGSGQTFTDWLDRMRLVLLSEGFDGMDRELSALLSGELKEAERESMESLLKYLRKNSERLNYCERLAAGRSIGSGQVEGACKNLVGRRLKQTGACWRLEQANRMATLCAVLYSDQWKHCWKNPPKL
jgi:hypothetical protein